MGAHDRGGMADRGSRRFPPLRRLSCATRLGDSADQSGQAALYSTAIPLFLVLIDAVRRRRMPSALVMLGLVLGTAGVGLLVRGDALNAGTPVDRALMLLSSFGWAAGSLVGRHGARPRSAIQATAMQLCMGALFVLAASALHGDLARASSAWMTPRVVGAVLYLILCGTVIAFAAYTWLLRVASPAQVSSYAYVTPMVALLLGVLVGDDQLTARVLLAAVLVTGAVVLTTVTREPVLDQ